MRTIETVLYKFSELPDEAKQKAIESLSGINVDYNWWECAYEDAANIGLKITGFGLDRQRGATGEFTLSAAEVAANILKDHGDQCETYATALTFLDAHDPLFAELFSEENNPTDEDGQRFSDIEDELQDLENDFLEELLEDYSIMLQNEFEDLQSEEAIIETIEANEYEFNEDGTQF